MISTLDILNFSLFLLAICLTIWNINQRYNTNKTTTIINHVFPLKFSILINPGFDHSKLVEMGYSSDSNYILGVNRLGIPQQGWAGHSKEGSPIGNVSGILYEKFRVV